MTFLEGFFGGSRIGAVFQKQAGRFTAPLLFI